MRILVADNESLIASTLSDFFRKCGHQVYSAHNAAETLQLIDKNSNGIDAVIADLRLCQQGSRNLIETIKKDYPDIDIILLSGYGNDLSIRQAIELGAVSVQRKPVSLQELELVVSQLEDKHKTRGRLESISEDLQNGKAKESTNIRDRQYLRKMHGRLIPRNFDWIKHTDVCIRYLPMSGIGGDFIDLRYLDDENLLIFLADVSGSGLPAAFSASAFKIWFNSIAPLKDPSEILKSADHIVREVLPEEYLVTAFCGIYNESSKVLTYSLAGHLEPVIIQNSGNCECLYANGPALGLDIPKDFEIRQYKFESGDYLLIYTDGLTEQPEDLAMQISKEYSQWKTVRKNSHSNEDLLTFIFDEAAQMNPARAFADDIAVLLIAQKMTAVNKPASRLSGKRVLVVDDNKSILNLVTDLLQQDGAMVKCLADGASILEVVDEFKPDMVIMDIYMPGVSGLDAMSVIHSRYPSLPVLLMTGQEPQEHVTVAVSKKAAGLLAKPFSLQAFRETVQAALDYKPQRDDIQIDTISRDWLDCIISSSPQCLQMLTNYLMILNKQPIPADILNDLIYCIREIAGNAIEWGNHHNPGLKVRISTVLLEDRALVRIQDEGGGFNARQVFEENEDVASSQMERQRLGKRDGGFGLPIVRSMVDHIAYNERGNSAVLTKYFNKQEVV